MLTADNSVVEPADATMDVPQVEEERMKLNQRLRDQHFYTRSLIEPTSTP